MNVLDCRRKHDEVLTEHHKTSAVSSQSRSLVSEPLNAINMPPTNHERETVPLLSPAEAGSSLASTSQPRKEYYSYFENMEESEEDEEK